MVKLQPRKRPRKRSIAWSRLGWLIETEAAFQVITFHRVRYRLAYWQRATWGRSTHRLAQMRALARSILARQEVIL